MHIKPGFKLRTVMGQSIIVAEGSQQVNFNKLISLNDSAALLWQAVEGKDFTNEDLAKALTEQYAIDYATALNDATEISDKWKENGLVDA